MLGDYSENIWWQGITPVYTDWSMNVSLIPSVFRVYEFTCETVSTSETCFHSLIGNFTGVAGSNKHFLFPIGVEWWYINQREQDLGPCWYFCMTLILQIHGGWYLQWTHLSMWAFCHMCPLPPPISFLFPIYNGATNTHTPGRVCVYTYVFPKLFSFSSNTGSSIQAVFLIRWTSGQSFLSPLLLVSTLLFGHSGRSHSVDCHHRQLLCYSCLDDGSGPVKDCWLFTDQLSLTTTCRLLSPPPRAALMDRASIAQPIPPPSTLQGLCQSGHHWQLTDWHGGKHQAGKRNSHIVPGLHHSEVVYSLPAFLKRGVQMFFLTP